MKPLSRILRSRRIWSLAILGLGIALLIGLYTFWPSTPPGERLCRRFMELKNAADSRALELLGPAPAALDDAASDEQAERFDAESILRGDFQVLEVRPESDESKPSAAGFALVMKGSYFEPRRSRTLINPEVIVEVEAGKLRGLRARAQSVKPLTPEELRMLLEKISPKDQ